MIKYKEINTQNEFLISFVIPNEIMVNNLKDLFYDSLYF